MTRTLFPARTLVYSLIGLVIIAGAGIALTLANGNGYETMTVSRSDFRRTVSVTGKVVAAQKADLGFEQSGRIARITVRVGDRVSAGDTIASLEDRDLEADVLQRQASLDREQARLASIEQGTRPEQLALDRQVYADASRALAVTLRSSYFDVENAFLDKVDPMFDNGNSVNPTIAIPTRHENERIAANRERLEVTNGLKAWNATLPPTEAPVPSNDLDEALDAADQAFTSSKAFLARLSAITGALSTTKNAVAQSDIDTYRSSVNAASQATVAALESLQSAENAWRTAWNKLALSESGSVQADIDAQAASVKAARAELAATEARLAKARILAPFDGTVTRMDLDIGEVASPGTSPVSLMDTGSLRIEAYVPEVHIANIRPGNPADVTLDAYGSAEHFPAAVASIDPAETIRDGVSTYKVVLIFSEADVRIRPGMTADATIITLEIPDAIVVPKGVIIERGGRSFVTKLMDGSPIEAPVEIGGSTSLGQVEITAGLDEGEMIVLPPTAS